MKKTVSIIDTPQVNYDTLIKLRGHYLSDNVPYILQTDLRSLMVILNTNPNDLNHDRATFNKYSAFHFALQMSEEQVEKIVRQSYVLLPEDFKEGSDLVFKVDSNI